MDKNKTYYRLLDLLNYIENMENDFRGPSRYELLREDKVVDILDGVRQELDAICCEIDNSKENWV